MIANDLISRQAVFDTLKEVFREYNMEFRPGGSVRGFASAVPRAIADIPAIYTFKDTVPELRTIAEKRCVKYRDRLPDREEFMRVMKPAIRWLQENGCHHERVIIEYDGAELVGGEMAFSVEVPD